MTLGQIILSVAGAAVIFLWAWAIASAATQPSERWDFIGKNKVVWVIIAAIVPLGWAGYLLSMRPRLLAAARPGAQPPRHEAGSYPPAIERWLTVLSGGGTSTEDQLVTFAFFILGVGGLVFAGSVGSAAVVGVALAGLWITALDGIAA
jgi:hypothetical protein